MERDAIEILLLGKVTAQTPLAIQTGGWDDDFCFVANATLEGDGAGDLH